MRKFFLLFLFLNFAAFTQAQISGTKSIPGDYATIADAVTALNSSGVGSGGVTFNVLPGHNEFPAATINITATGTSANPIIFQKNGSGTNPKITFSSAGTLITSTFGGDGDAVVKLNGSDYITFNGIDIEATDQGIEYGFYLFKPSGTDGCQNVTIKNAVIDLTKGTSAYVTGIYISNGPTSVSSATGVTVTANSGRNENITITGCTIQDVHNGIVARGFTSATFYDQNIIIGQSGAGNTINNFGGGTASAAYGVYLYYQNNANIDYNTLDNAGNGGTAATSTLYGIYFLTSTGVVTANNNAYTLSQSSSSTTYGFYNTNLLTSINLNNNSFTSGTLSSTGTIYLLYNSSSTPNVTVNNNSNTGTFNRTGAGTIYCYYNLGSPASGTETFTNNNFSNITGASSCYGYYSNTAVGQNRVAHTNTFTSWTVTASIYAMYCLSTTNNQVYNNIINNLTSSGTGTIYGIYFTGTNASVYGNNIHTLTTGGTTFYGIYNGASGSSNTYKNKIYNLSTTSTSTAVVYGIYVTTGTDNTIHNNIIGNLTAPASTSTTGVVGIYISAGTSINLYYNTIYLNASSSGANFGSSGIYASSTPTVIIRNNIVVNNSTAAGTGFAAAYRRSSTTIGTYSSSSNNNLWYAGTPSATNVIFYDGTNSDQTLAAYKSRVSPADGASFTENPTFVSTTGSDATYLHINTTAATQIESGGTAITGITTDFDGDTRHATTPDVGADEFTGVGIDLTGPGIAFTDLTNTICTTNRTFTATITDASVVNTTAGTKPRLYYKKSTENNSLPATNTSADNGWKWVEATNSSSPFSFTLDYSKLNSAIAVNDIINYFMVAQDNATTPNVGSSGVSFTANPTTVALLAGAFPVSNQKSFTVNAQPGSIVITSDKTDLCISGTVTLSTSSTVNGADLQWQSSAAGANTWSNISGGTTSPFTTASFSTATDFRLVVSCGGTPIGSSPSNTIAITVNSPTVASTTPATRCGTGTVTLGATASSGATLKWYAAATGGAALGTGTSFTTPTVSTTTAFYVSASAGGSTSDYSKLTYESGSSATNLTTYGQDFTVTESITLNSVQVFSTTGTAITISLYNSTGITQLQTTGSTVVVAASSPTINLGWAITPGTYRLVANGMTGNFYRDNTNTTYPISLGSFGQINGFVSSITGSVTTSSSYYFMYKWNITTGCESARTAVTATVTTPPSITPSGTATICDGNSTPLGVTSGNTGYTYVWTPGNLSGAAQTVSPTANTTYTVTATDASGGANNGCATTGDITITVNPSPSTLNVTPATNTQCSDGAAKQLTTSGGIVTGNATFGTETTTNATTSYPSPYTNYYGGAKHQMLILASELIAQGVTAGTSLTSLTMNVTAVGSTFSGSLTDFQIDLASTTSTALTSTAFIGGLTNVLPATTVAIPTTGLPTSVAHTFTTPYTWDGTSNIVVQTSYSNGNSGTSTDFVQMTNSVTAFVSTNWYRADGATSAAVLSASIPSGSGTSRPNMTLGYNTPATITWSPITGLYTDASATVPYVFGADLTTVYAKPLTTTTYTATATNTYNCTKTSTSVITVNCTLPVTLTSLAGSKEINGNVLRWTTQTEQNNKGFDIERSTDGRTFSTIGFVASKATNGNSNQNISYSFVDDRAANNAYYYRLRQVDLDNKASLSNTIRIKGEKATALTLSGIYPNPVQEKLNITIDAPTRDQISLVVTDIYGKQVMQQFVSVETGSNTASFAVNHLSSGTYIIKIISKSNNETSVSRFVKQ